MEVTGVQPPAWVQDAVFYQIFPDRFCNGDQANDPPGVRPWGEPPTPTSFFGGDLWGILKKLDYLENLGVNALYLTPIFLASTNHRYDTEDYFQVDPVLGGNTALRELVREAHRRKMRIILDGVFNHCGRGHPFFRDAQARRRQSPYGDWFMWEEEEPGYSCWAGCPGLPEWNHDNPQVREYLLSVVRYWLEEYEIDGWRLDTVEYLPPDFVREVYRTVKTVNPEAYVLGEVMGLGTPWFRHRALDGVMHYRLWEGLVHFFAEEVWDAPRFVRYVWHIWRSYPMWANFASYTLLGSHDKPRFLTLAGGERRKFLLAVAFLFAFPGAPAIYYGDEVGLAGGDDPDCRRCFPWEEVQPDHPILSVIGKLVRRRRETESLRRGGLKFPFAQGRALLLSRPFLGTETLLALNAGTKEEVLMLPSGRFREEQSGEFLSGTLRLPPYSFTFLKRVS
ncbi:MAG: glycoside hydrolase family 13 protein [Candidatus Bipolaricaulota bacterium]|nr:glycoside hydrolase family 13 protein [Candidatus Bipolaricaulota bacterium]MDW8126785.1 glycoside hydrolase family 13 protein [Candidatus Bipolaricaulota bacterium]